VDQRGRHVDKFRAQVHIHLPRPIQVLQILGSNGGDGDILDVDLLFANQVQQQVEGPFIFFQMDV